jgi:hypothetical protein
VGDWVLRQNEELGMFDVDEIRWNINAEKNDSIDDDIVIAVAQGLENAHKRRY